MSDLSWFRNRFPYTKLNDINLDWLLKRMKELSALVVGYADDIQRALTQSSTAITQSEAAVNSANNAISIANSASATANAVSGIAEDARTIASAANNTALHAETVANGIAETAQSALDTAQSAESIAENAAQGAENAQTTAQNAVTIANGSNTRAGNAEQSALTAISTASAAQQTATEAAQDAQTAQQAATAAAQDAETAQQAATTAAQDAETAQQDAETAQQTATAAAQTATTAAQTATTAAQDAQTAQQAATTIAIDKADLIKETISGNAVAFPDGADGMALRSLVLNIEPVQEGSGDPSPQNIWTVSGWTMANFFKSGRNLLGGDALRDSVEYALPAAVDHPAERYIEFRANTEEAHKISDLRHLVSAFESGNRFTFIMTYGKTGTSTRSNLRVDYTDGTYDRIPDIPSVDNIGTVVFVSAAGKTIKSFGTIPYAGDTLLYYDDCGIFEGVLSENDFLPFVGSGAAVYWSGEAGTVYKGEYNAKIGELTVQGVGAVLDGSENWTAIGAGESRYYRFALPESVIAQSGMCSHFPNRNLTSNTTGIGCRIWVSNNVPYLAIRPEYPAIQTVDAFSAWLAEQVLAGTPVTCWWELETPHVYTLASVFFTTLLGVNNIWADCGPINVEYGADTKLYIEKINAPSDNDMIADAQIASSKYFIIGGSLYKSTTVIAQGDTVIPGSNCIVTNLADALNSLI